MSKDSLYLDTDVWVNFILYSRNKRVRKSHRKTLPLDAIDPKKVEVFISEINLIEISEKLADEKRMKKCFDDGLSLLEMRKSELEKKKLIADELEQIDKEINRAIMSQSFIVSNKTPTLGPKILKSLTEICTKYSIFFIDGLHFLIAEDMACKYFVTGDNDLSTRLRRLQSDIGEATTQVIHVSSFKNNQFKKLL